MIIAPMIEIFRVSERYLSVLYGAMIIAPVSERYRVIETYLSVLYDHMRYNIAHHMRLE